MNTKTTFLILTLLSVLSCCRDGSSERHYLSCGVAELPLQFVEETSFVTLDKTIPLSYVKKIAFIDGQYYVLAQNGLFRFSENGLFIGEVSSRGRAKNEWLYINTFYHSLRDDSICIIDGASSKIIHYSLEGKYLKTEKIKGINKLQVVNACETPEGLILNCGVYNNDASVFIKVSSDSARVLSKLITIPARTKNVIQNTGRHPLTCWGDTLKCLLPFDNTIYIPSQNKLMPYATIPVDYKVLKQRVYKREKDYSLIRLGMDCMSNNIFAGFDSIFETNRWIILSFYDVYFSIVDKMNNTSYSGPKEAVTSAIGIPLDNIMFASENSIYCYKDNTGILMCRLCE